MLGLNLGFLGQSGSDGLSDGVIFNVVVGSDNVVVGTDNLIL
jgi:hypothetical protein